MGSGGAGGSVLDGSVGGAKVGSVGVATEGNGSAVALSGGTEAGMATDAAGIEGRGKAAPLFFRLESCLGRCCR